MTAVLVTGATGFIGQSMCRELQSHGHDVRAASRVSARDLPAPTVTVGDIGPQTDWSAALSGREAVVHLAAHVHVKTGKAVYAAHAFERVNVRGSENLARQAARAGVRRFLFVSSVKVNGDRTTGQPFVESDPAAPADAYGASKAKAEEALKAVAAETGMELVIARPPLVYGPGVKANYLSLLRIVDAGWPLPLASVSNRRSLVYVGNLSSALAACLTSPAAANRTYFISDDQDVSTPRLLEAIAAALGRRPRLFAFPLAALRATGRMLGRQEQISRLIESLQVDISRIKTELGWRPPFSLEQGLAETALWYRSRHP